MQRIEFLPKSNNATLAGLAFGKQNAPNGRATAILAWGITQRLLPIQSGREVEENKETNRQDRLNEWLSGQPRNVAALLALRAGLRTLPCVPESFVRYGHGAKSALKPTPLLRLSLAATVQGRYGTDATLGAVRSALPQCDEYIGRRGAHADAWAVKAIRSALDAEVMVTISHTHWALGLVSGLAANKGGNKWIWDAVEHDISLHDSGVALDERPLWWSTNPVADVWRTAKRVLSELSHGDFWIDWYQRALDGRPQNWPLLRDIALIDDALWEQGGEALGQVITDLRRQHGMAATANAERIESNPDTGRLRLVPDSDLPEQIAAYVRRKIIKATDVFADSTGQAYGALDPDLAMLRRAVADAGNLPLELLDACAAATRRLAIRIDTGDCPAAAQDPLIADYQSRLREAGADILASDPEAQKVLARRAAIDGDRSLIEARQAIEETVAAVAPVLEGRLAEALPLDAQTASDPDARSDDRAAASFRLAGRLLRIERALPFAADVCKGFGAGSGVVVGVASYLQAMEFMATSPAVRLAMAAIYRYIGL